MCVCLYRGIGQEASSAGVHPGIMKELTRGGVGDSKLTSLLLQAQQQKDFSMDEVDEPKGITVKNIEVSVYKSSTSACT